MATQLIRGLVEALLAHRDAIEAEVEFDGDAFRDPIDHLRKLEALEEAGGEVALRSEELWPFLLAAGFGSEPRGRVQLAGRLIEGHERPAGRVVVGGSAAPTRTLEGPTQLAIALGDLERRSGLLSPTTTPSWIGACECRFMADISTAVADTPHRNKLARTIEAACRLGRAPDCRIHVTLVSPQSFRRVRSRLYTERFQAYAADVHAIVRDLAACRLAPLYAPSELSDALERVTLHWLTYDELFHDLPDTEVGRAIRAFRRHFDWTTVL